VAGGINRHSPVAQAAPPDLPCGWGQLRENWAYKWWLDLTEAREWALLAAFEENGKVFSRMVRDEIRYMRRTWPGLADHLERTCRAAAGEKSWADDEPSSPLDVRERVFADHSARSLDWEMSDQSLMELAFNPHAHDSRAANAPTLPPIAAARATLETVSYEQLVMTRDLMHFAYLFSDRDRWWLFDEILDSPMDAGGGVATYSLLNLATDRPLVEHFGASGKLPVVAFDRDLMARLPPVSSPFVYWRFPRGYGLEVGNLECPDLEAPGKGPGKCFVLLLCPCAPRHPALVASDKVAAEQGRTEADEVWFVFLLSWQVLSRMRLTDSRSPELYRLLQDGVPHRHLYVPSEPGLLVPEYLADDEPTFRTSPEVIQGALSSAALRSPDQFERLTRARAFLNAYASQSGMPLPEV
jgi:hypothetical protein